MNYAQPALLYLVPMTLLPCIIISLMRQEFRQFWLGPEKDLNAQGASATSTILDSNDEQQPPSPSLQEAENDDASRSTNVPSLIVSHGDPVAL